MPEAPQSQRCVACNLNWPTSPSFRTCPRCEAETDGCWMRPDFTHTEAEQKRKAWSGWRTFIAARPDPIDQLEEAFNAVD